ncbi:Ca-activated chloride channel family protein [Stigmatella aurantiaca]|uniref:Ca-activated chloride channel family protein n=1 Tax=Stigmatella aurantiaca TaxID=41 RepID=A0A1H8E7E8_STIAU|nr:von Willebrand factor type A domain-containing protein [Stigmatella aurantiaca]SEN15479.1 Ca-activated chloride channel family protein [Stigmatella aurantiaca]
MSPSTLYRLSLWGSAFLGLSLLPSCLSAKGPTAEIALAHDGAAPQSERVSSAPASKSADTLAEGEAAPSFAPPPPPPAAPAPMKAERKGKMLVREAPAEPMPEPRREGGNTFEAQQPHAFTVTHEDALSTFAADVDTASYTLARRYLNQGSLPPPAAVRVEEFVNYFSYRYAPPAQGAFTVHLEGAPSPFAAGRHFLRVGVQGKVVSRSQRKPAHLVFLVDTSGSMQSEDKLPLAKEAMKVAVKNLNENDTVALVTYAGSTQDVLPPTPATEVQRIHAAIDGLQSGGGTAMGSGMELAYRHAIKKASAHAVSRVIVLTDGDANIGPNLSAKAMLSGIGKYVAEGVTLSTIGFGMGNYRDDLMERLADQGNGNCFYVDSFQEAKKVFEAQLTGTLEVIAKDVKFQVEFNPEAVRRYRLVGYENRDVADRDFRNDKVDAGEIGAGHTVTALYEVELTGEAASLATVRIRAKAPNGTEAAEQSFPFPRSLVRGSMEAASTDFRFALAVASTADILRASPAAQGWSLAQARALAEGATEGRAERTEFVTLVSRAQALGSTTAERGY